MEILFLGTGTSHGVPEIDCMINDYATCPQDVCSLSRSDPKHNRTRCSLLVGINGKQIIVDTSLDFRAQMLRHRIKHIDAVLLTHIHSDHVQGLPDIRSYCTDHALDVYGSKETISGIKQSFRYMFEKPKIRGGGIPNLRAHIKPSGKVFELFGVEVTPAIVEHGSLEGCFGYRIGNLGYIPDVKTMPVQAKVIFQELDMLVLNMLRRAPEHSTHLTLRESVALAEELNPKSCYFTHMCHDIHYGHDKAQLPENMDFAHDGLRIFV